MGSRGSCVNGPTCVTTARRGSLLRVRRLRTRGCTRTCQAARGACVAVASCIAAGVVGVVDVAAAVDAPPPALAAT